MTGKAGFLWTCFLLLVFSGCTSESVFSVEVYETPTSLETPPPQPEIDLVSTSTPLPIVENNELPTTAVNPVMPADFSPILYGKKYDANMFFLVLGAVQGDAWFTPRQAAAQFGGEWNYDVHTFQRGSFQVAGKAPVFSPVSGGYYSIGTDSTYDEFGMVGVLHGWPVRQGSVQELSADNESYRQVVLDWLKSQGVDASEAGNLQIFRVDLEANGVDEIFISATHLDESQHFTKAGDYSLILMRKVAGNEAVTLPLVADIYRSQDQEITFPPTYSIGNFIDLNKDGVLEVVVDIERWEGFGAIVYEVDGQNVIERLR